MTAPNPTGDSENIKLCACGCGTPVTRGRYVSGHSLRCYVKTEEHIRKIVECNLRRADAKRNASHKRCPHCRQVKPRDEFGLRTSGVLRSLCRLCSAKKRQERTKSTDPQKLKEQSRRNGLYVSHGIREEDYRDLLSKQDGRCAICGADRPGVDTNSSRVHLYVDHDHSTGEIRGLLCSRCNFGIGYFRDDPGLLLKATEYLRNSRTGKYSVCRRRRGGARKKKGEL